jgi:hypothetical protein
MFVVYHNEKKKKLRQSATSYKIEAALRRKRT